MIKTLSIDVSYFGELIRFCNLLELLVLLVLLSAQALYQLSQSGRAADISREHDKG